MRKRRRLSLSIVLLALAPLLGCGGDGVLGPNAALALLVGDWQADRFRVTNKANANQAPELIHDLGAQFTLNVQPSGQYTAVLAYQGTPITEIGTLDVEQGEVVFHVSYPAVETSRSRYSITADRLILDGDTEFDFNADGKADPALAHIEMKKR